MLKLPDALFDRLFTKIVPIIGYFNTKNTY